MCIGEDIERPTLRLLEEDTLVSCISADGLGAQEVDAGAVTSMVW